MLLLNKYYKCRHKILHIFLFNDGSKPIRAPQLSIILFKIRLLAVHPPTQPLEPFLSVFQVLFLFFMPRMDTNSPYRVCSLTSSQYEGTAACSLTKGQESPPTENNKAKWRMLASASSLHPQLDTPETASSLVITLNMRVHAG